MGSSEHRAPRLQWNKMSTTYYLSYIHNSGKSIDNPVTYHTRQAAEKDVEVFNQLVNPDGRIVIKKKVVSY